MNKKQFSSRSIGTRLGYSDDDLSTPGHDALVLWAVDHCEELAAEFLGVDTVYFPAIEVRGKNGGWIDVLITADLQPEKPHQYIQRLELAIEVKTTIRSLGELMRQLRSYECQKESDHELKVQTERRVLVLSADDRFAAAIRSQGFLFKVMSIPGDDSGAST